MRRVRERILSSHRRIDTADLVRVLGQREGDGDQRRVRGLFFAMALFISQRNALALLCALGLSASLAIWIGVGNYGKVRKPIEGKKGGLREAMTGGIVVLTAITAMRSIANTGVSVWLPTYITFVRGAGVGSTLGFTIAATYLGAIPGQLVFGTLVERLDKRYVLGISSAGASLAVLGYISTGGVTSLAFIVLFGFFSYSSFPTLLSLATDYVPASSWTAANGFVWGLGIMGGNVIGPAVTQLIIGDGYQRLGLAFGLLAVVGLVGAAVTPLMKKGIYGKKQEITK
jgi:fucose permease